MIYLFYSLAFFVVLFFLLLKIRRYKDPGNVGERKIRKILKRLPLGYKVLNDVLLTTSDGYTQIDHIVIGSSGIFVIETKNYKGMIYGDENKKFWKQVLYNTTNEHYNPIWQNNGHISSIQHSLRRYFSNLSYYNVIVFSEGSILKDIKSTVPVIHDNNLFNYILSKKNIKNMTQKQVNAVYDILNKANIKDKKIRRNHIKDVKSKK